MKMLEEIKLQQTGQVIKETKSSYSLASLLDKESKKAIESCHKNMRVLSEAVMRAFPPPTHNPQRFVFLKPCKLALKEDDAIKMTCVQLGGGVAPASPFSPRFSYPAFLMREVNSRTRINVCFLQGIVSLSESQMGIFDTSLVTSDQTLATER